MSSQVKEEKKGQYGQMEKNNNELEGWTKNKQQKKCAYTWSCSLFHLFFNTATCGEGLYMHAKWSEYSSQYIILQHQGKPPFKGFHNL